MLAAGAPAAPGRRYAPGRHPGCGPGSQRILHQPWLRPARRRGRCHAADRRSRFLAAIPAGLARAVTEFSDTQLTERDRARRAGRRPLSDTTLETGPVRARTPRRACGLRPPDGPDAACKALLPHRAALAQSRGPPRNGPHGIRVTRRPAMPLPYRRRCRAPALAARNCGLSSSVPASSLASRARSSPLTYPGSSVAGPDSSLSASSSRSRYHAARCSQK